MVAEVACLGETGSCDDAAVTAAVRPATPDDAAEIARLGALMFESMGLEPGGAWREAAVRRLTAGLADGSVVAFVVDGDGALAANAAGTIARRLPGPLNPGGLAGYVQYVCTDRAWRGRGLARAVTTALVEWYRAQGVGVVELHATTDGEPLYRAMGFDEGPNPALRLRLV
jgi:GNAT superfamily N-acetyltransferase